MLPKQARGTLRKHVTKPLEQVATPPSSTIQNLRLTQKELKFMPSYALRYRKRVSQLSLQQRQLLKVKKEDIFISFIYQIGILMEDIQKEEEGKWWS